MIKLCCIKHTYCGSERYIVQLLHNFPASCMFTGALKVGGGRITKK